MNQVPVKLGPLALLLSVISICLTTLAILSFSTSAADTRLAEKYAEAVQIRYRLEKEGQEFLHNVSEGGSSGVVPDAEGIIRQDFEENGFVLHIGLTDSGKILFWRIEKLWEEDTEINIWDGMPPR